MRIVLLDEKKLEREALMRALAAAKYSAEGVSDEASALAAITREPPQIVVFSVPSKGGADLVRRLKGADASNQAYLLALFDAAPSGHELSTVLEAGANDFLRRPLLDAELFERLKAPSRLMRWARAVAPTAFDFSAPLRVSGLKSWTLSGPAGRCRSLRNGRANIFDRQGVAGRLHIRATRRGHSHVFGRRPDRAPRFDRRR
jgi:two-component system cell cycle response regulator